MNEREGLLRMLGWEEHQVVKHAIWEYLEDPLSGGPLVRRSNSMEVFGSGNQIDRERAVAYSAVNGNGTQDHLGMAGMIKSIRRGTSPVIVDGCCAPLSIGGQIAVAQEASWELGGHPRALLAGPETLSSLPKKGDAETCDPIYPWASYALVTAFGIVDVVPCIFVPNRIALLVDPLLARLVSTEDGSEATLEICNAGDGGHALIQNIGEQIAKSSGPTTTTTEKEA